MTSFRSRCQVVSTELVPPVVVVPSAKIQSVFQLGAKTYRHTLKEVKSVENCGEGKNVKILVEGGGRVKTPFRCVCSFDFSNCHQ